MRLHYSRAMEVPPSQPAPATDTIQPVVAPTTDHASLFPSVPSSTANATATDVKPARSRSKHRSGRPKKEKKERKERGTEPRSSSPAPNATSPPAAPIILSTSPPENHVLSDADSGPDTPTSRPTSPPVDVIPAHTEPISSNNGGHIRATSGGPGITGADRGSLTAGSPLGSPREGRHIVSEVEKDESWFPNIPTISLFESKKEKKKRLWKQHKAELLAQSDPGLVIVAFVNPLSGAQKGSELLPLLQKELGEAHVFDIVKEKGPYGPLDKFKNAQNLRIVACGGDGTIRWVIDGIAKTNFRSRPALGIIPIGTGNDLSREFGWGIAYTPKSEEIIELVQDLRIAKTRPLDIWEVHITPWDPRTGEQNPAAAQHTVMFNYFNMGFDPQAQYGFHIRRKESPELFKARFVNKCWYALHAADTVLSGTPNLTDSIRVRADGNLLVLPPELKTLIFLNFTCYQGGMDVWGPVKEKDHFRKPNMADDVLEIVGIGGVAHEALARLEIIHGLRMGQAGHIEIEVIRPDTIAMAYDGEPFLQEPSVIDIKLWGKLGVLYNPEQEMYAWLKAAGKDIASPTSASPTSLSPRRSRPTSPQQMRLSNDGTPAGGITRESSKS